MASDGMFMAIVEKIIENGRHGPFAIASTESLGSVTFSLDNSVWQEKDWPEPGMVVMLSEVRRKRAGWRAKQGRFLTPSDEQPTQYSKEQRA